MTEQPTEQMTTDQRLIAQMMTDEQIREALAAVAANLHLEDAELRVERNRRWIHLLICSPSFKGMPMEEREDAVWRDLADRLDDLSMLRITQYYFVTPEERDAELGLVSASACSA